MILLSPATPGTAAFAWCQRQVTDHHYLHAPVDGRCRPLAYLVVLEHCGYVGCLIFGRPESTRCYTGGLTYGSQDDVHTRRAEYDRWEIINLARVWLSPEVQPGGVFYGPDLVPGFTDRHGRWRSTLASTVIGQALDRVRLDYLMFNPPCFLDEPYQLRACLSYCDTNLHRGVIYRASGFSLARRNERGIETWSKPLPVLSADQDLSVRQQSAWDQRAMLHRARRHAPIQLTLQPDT